MKVSEQQKKQKLNEVANFLKVSYFYNIVCQ